MKTLKELIDAHGFVWFAAISAPRKKAVKAVAISDDGKFIIGETLSSVGYYSFHELGL